MTEMRATVLRAEAGEVWLRLEARPGGCGRCDEPGGCRSTRLTDVFKTSGGLIRLPDSLGCSVGDGLVISAAESAPLAAAVLGYMLPLGLMLGFGALALWCAPFASPDANVAVGVAVGLVGGVATGRRILSSGRWPNIAVTMRPAGQAPATCRGQP